MLLPIIKQACYGVGLFNYDSDSMGAKIFFVTFFRFKTTKITAIFFAIFFRKLIAWGGGENMATTETFGDAREAYLNAIYDSIKELTKKGSMGGVPSGHLYSALMGVMRLTTFQSIIATLKERGKVTEAGHFLKAT